MALAIADGLVKCLLEYSLRSPAAALDPDF